MRLKEEVRCRQTIKKSEFIACAAPAASEAQARSYIESIRSEFPDADHVCTAYICGENGSCRRSSDNHEPAGTAGVPILEAIVHAGLNDTCVCVVRYFGGIKLGTGGLARAYGGCAAEALQKGKKVEQASLPIYELTCSYETSGLLEGWLRKNTEILGYQYGDKVICTFVSSLPDIVQKLKDLSHGSCVIRQAGTAERLIPVEDSHA